MRGGRGVRGGVGETITIVVNICSNIDNGVREVIIVILPYKTVH